MSIRAWYIGLLLAISAPAACRAEALPTGVARIEIRRGTNLFTVFTYKPKTYQAGPFILVLHGLSRNAEDYRNYAISLADRFNAIVAVPLFDKDRFPGDTYSRGGVTQKGEFQPRENWLFPVVNTVVDEVRKREGRSSIEHFLFGHSAGGQFLMRLAALQSTDATRIVAANPGSDLFPRRDWNFTYGFGGLPPEFSDDAALQRYLAAPLTLYLGTADTNRNDTNLDHAPGAMQEGAFRLERGRACYAYAENLARERGWKFNWRKVETPGIGHDGKGMINAKEAGIALFGESASHTSNTGATNETLVLALTNGTPKTKVAVYFDRGTGSASRKKSPRVLKQIATLPDTAAFCVTAEQIRAGILKDCQVAIFPGGSGHIQAAALEETGCSEIVSFIRNGGQYIGICAGAYLATSGYPWSLKVLNAQTVSTNWQRGQGNVTMELTDAGRKIFGNRENAFPVYYANGPIIKPSTMPQLPEFQILANFRSELAEHNSPVGAMVNSPAIATAPYGRGRVLFISPHPEGTPGLETFVPNAVTWLLSN